MRRSGRALDVQHTRFKLDAVFDESATNDEVCIAAVAPLLAWLAATRRRATLLFFGQTGTGKTHSLMGALAHFVADADARLSGRPGAAVLATAYEVKGSRCFDLLANRARVKLLCGADGRMHVRGARSVVVDAGASRQAGVVAAELRRLLDGALALRATLATERNSNSSRSHLVVTLSIAYGDERGGSVFTLVDLAGSERKHETTAMSATEHRESASINTALMALKDCCRASHRGARRIPYRASMLTRVLRDCFVAAPHLAADIDGEGDGECTVRGGGADAPGADGAAHRTVVVATLSPTSEAMHHTLNTLKHVSMMRPDLAAQTLGASSYLAIGAADATWRSVHVLQWSVAHVSAWLRSVDGGTFAHVVLPPETTGKSLMRLATSATSLASLFASAEGDAMRSARRNAEGASWVLGIETFGGAARDAAAEEPDVAPRVRDWGRELFEALRSEARRRRSGDRAHAAA
jgi:kinesin family protein 2/24